MSRTYSRQFREEALKLSDEIGMKKAVAQLGIPYYTLATWRNNRSAMKKAGITLETADETPETKRIQELEKEIYELRQANEILKDALGFFAKDRKK